MRRTEFKQAKEKPDGERSRRFVRLLATGLARYFNDESVENSSEHPLDFPSNLSVTTDYENGEPSEEF